MEKRSYKRILVTSALPYANGPLHLGHIAGAYLPADIYVRYQRLKGKDVIYICGSDEHGVPITVTADNEKISPQDVVDRYHKMNKKAFEQLGMSFDNYSRTSLPVHHQTAQEFFTTLYKKGDLITRSEKQFYSESSKRFLPDRYVEGTCPHCDYDKARGDQCDHCGKWLNPAELVNPASKIDGSKPVLKETKHWYLPMGRFAEAWKSWFNSQEWKENVKNYSMGWYKEGLGDRPITRDLHWGVPVPLDNAGGKVLYVWFDAPIGYISATKEWAQNQGTPDKWKEYWCDKETKLVHFIGKDNVVFHAILFPMMLMEMGDYVLPSAIPANEYLTIEGRKISTSQNYAIWVKDYLDNFPADPLRYTLAANAPEGKDTDFSWSQLQSRNNDELADIVGNFVNRTMTFVHRYRNGKVPPVESLSELDETMIRQLKTVPEVMGNQLDHFELRKAVKTFMDLARFSNKYFNDKEPWKTRKDNPDDCSATLNLCLQAACVLGVLMAPVMPDASEKIKHMMGLAEFPHWDQAGNLPLSEGHVLGTAEILFTKIEDDVIQKEIRKLHAIGKETETNTTETEEPLKIDFEMFKQLDLRTAKVLEAEKVSGADKLLKLQIEVGEEKRQIIAGVAQSYTPEALVGKLIVIVANLKPAKIRGIESNGMLLAVTTDQGHSLLTADSRVSSGLRVG